MSLIVKFEFLTSDIWATVNVSIYFILSYSYHLARMKHLQVSLFKIGNKE